MRYQPLLLALLLGLTAPVMAANDAPKEKAAAKKTVKTKAEAAKADAKKDAKAKAAPEKSKKAAEKAADSKKTREADKPAKKAQDVKTKEKDSKRQEKAETASKNSKKENAKKADESPAKARAAAKNSKEKSDKNAPVKAAAKAEKNEKAAQTRAEKKAEKEKAAQAKKEAAEEKKAERSKKAAADKQAAPEKANKKAKNSADADSEVRAAVSAATNDLEEKQALNKRTDGFLMHVSTNLKQIQQARSNLSQINRQQRDAWEKLQKLHGDLSRLKTEVGNTRAQISRFVSGNYKNSQPNAVALFLKNAEPGQKTRFLRYTRYINSANEKVVKDLSRQQKALAAQESRINTELAYIRRLQANAQAALKKQGAANTAEQAESRRQNAKMAAAAQKAVNQKEREQRLNKLLVDLEKRKAEQRKQEAEARKKAAEARLAAAEKARQAKAAQQKKAEAERAAMSNLTDEDMKLQAPGSGSFVTVSNPNSFSRMQGRLNKPVNGMVAGLFGHQRNDGEVWKGVFYTTPPAAVNSIASGSVVYADNLEGYGNVVVLDHGDNYVSVYSGLSEIAVANGYTVGSGHKLGTSGTLPSGEEGLYLEIRYNGQNMNPLSWVN